MIENKNNGNGRSQMYSMFGVIVALFLGAMGIVFNLVFAVQEEVNKTEGRSKERSIEVDTKIQLEIAALDLRLQGELSDQKELLTGKDQSNRENVQLQINALKEQVRQLKAENKRLWNYHRHPPKAGP